MFAKICAVLTAVGALHGSVQWYTDTNYLGDHLGAQPTMAIQTVVGLAAVGLMVAVFKSGKDK
ncbi:MAG: hypothetical protein ACYTHK_17785 [Planctomycetota bacterium]